MHVKSQLAIHGRAAMVVPDNVLFEGGAGETVRRNLLRECDVHTLLRLPTGIFYAQGVKANVLFFDRKPGAKEPWTRTVWVYDLRTNKHFTLKTRRMARADLDEFVACYRPCARQTREATWSEQTPDGRWRPYSYDEVIGRDKVSLDLFWLRDESVEDSADLPRAATFWPGRSPPICVPPSARWRKSWPTWRNALASRTPPALPDSAPPMKGANRPAPSAHPSSAETESWNRSRRTGHLRRSLPREWPCPSWRAGPPPPAP